MKLEATRPNARYGPTYNNVASIEDATILMKILNRRKEYHGIFTDNQGNKHEWIKNKFEVMK